MIAVAKSTATVSDNDGTVHAAYVVNDGYGSPSYIVSVCEYMAMLRGYGVSEWTRFGLHETKFDAVDCMACIADSRWR